MVKQFNNNFYIYTSNNNVARALQIYSYNVEILRLVFDTNGKYLENISFCDYTFYNITTRRHLGIARAIGSYFTAHLGIVSEMDRYIKVSKSLRDLVNFFGYISIKN